MIIKRCNHSIASGQLRVNSSSIWYLKLLWWWMCAFISDCTPRQREDRIQKSDCMMGIPTETTRDKGRDMKSLSHSAEPIWYAAACPLLFNKDLLKQKQQQILVLLMQKHCVAFLLTVSDKFYYAKVKDSCTVVGVSSAPKYTCSQLLWLRMLTPCVQSMQKGG